MEIESEKPKDQFMTPNKDPEVFHAVDRESLSNSKYLQRIKTQRIVNNTRLIIHKITLENFKSYVGVREIGPFHKVNICLNRHFSLTLPSLLLLSSDLTVPESPIWSTVCCSFLVKEQNKWDWTNWMNWSITPPNIKISVKLVCKSPLEKLWIR